MSRPIPPAFAELAAEFDRLGRAALRRHPEFQQVVLHAAQYWDDQADDEVHFFVVAETAAALNTPHRCDTGRDSICCWCDFPAEPVAAAFRSLPWGSMNFDWQIAVERYCIEANQNMEQWASHRPLLRRVRDGQTEWVGRLHRPWLAASAISVQPPPPQLAPLYAEVYGRPNDDVPRQVLADLLQSRGDVHGQFIALQLRPSPTAAMQTQANALWAQHREAWLGALLPAAAPDACRATRGFVSTLAFARPRASTAELPSLLKRLATAAEWATVEHLILDEDREWVLLPCFKTIRVLEAPDAVIEPMMRMGAWHCEELRLPGRDPDILANLRLPALRSLVLAETHRRLPITATWWTQLEDLTVVASTPGVIVQALSHPNAMVQFTYRISPTDAVQGKRSTPFHLRLTCADPEALSAGFVDSLIYMMLSHGSGWQIEAQLTDAQIERLNAIGTARWIGLESA